MVEADSHLKPIPTSILDICKVFEQIDMLSLGIWLQPYSVVLTLLGSDFVNVGGKGNCNRDWDGDGNGDGDINGHSNGNRNSNWKWQWQQQWQW